MLPSISTGSVLLVAFLAFLIWFLAPVLLLVFAAILLARP